MERGGQALSVMGLLWGQVDATGSVGAGLSPGKLAHQVRVDERVGGAGIAVRRTGVLPTFR